MAVRDDDVLDVVLLLGRHRGDALAAAALRLIGVRRQALDVALARDRDHAAHAVDEVLDENLVLDLLDGGAALVAVLILDLL